MKKLLIAFALLCSFAAQGQQLFTAPTPFWQGVPTGAPSSQGARVRFDLVAGRWYSWTGSAWTALPWGIEIKTGNSAPAYTPGVAQSPLVLVTATGNLYQYVGPNAADWICRNCSTDAQTLSWNGSNGELSISGGNTVDLDGRYLTAEVDGSATNELQTLSISGFDLSLSNGGGTVTVPTPTLNAGPGIAITGTPSDVTISNTGILDVAAGSDISVSISGGTATISSTGGGGLTWPLLAPDGSDVAPSYSFENFPLSGFFHETGNLKLNTAPATNFSASLGSATGADGGGFNWNAGGSDTGTGGGFLVKCGGSTDGPGGQMSVSAGGSENGIGGLFSLDAGPSTNGTGGTFEMRAGDGAEGGGFTMEGGDATTGTGGGFTARAGNGNVGGVFQLEAGDSAAEDELGGNFNLLAGDGGGGGGQIYIAGGGSATASGGNVALAAGAGATDAVNGQIILTGNGVLFPGLTTTQRNNISILSGGLVIFNTTASKLQVYTGSAWVDLH